MSKRIEKILVLCTGNSCRSQIAEGYLRFFTGNEIEVYSAGLETHGVNQNAIRVMKEDGIDISNHTSNNVNEYLDIPFDLILTVCDHAQENCPYFPGKALRIHHNFPDPAKVSGSEKVIMEAFRNTRDMIKRYSKELVEGLK